MVKVSALYPNKPGSRFDANYYLTVHMPLAVKLLGPALKAATAEIGVSGGMPDQTAPYAAIAGFTCETVQAFTDAFLPNAAALQGDIPNYTDIAPVLQVSELIDFAGAMAETAST
jgi:uncharacterized protein (TIGR02118 family)